MRIRTLGALGLLVVGIAAIVLATVGPGFGSSTSSTRYLTSQAAVTDVVSQVAATGSVEAATTYSLSFGSAPTVTSGSASSSSSNSGSGSNSGTSSSWTVKSVTAQIGQAVKAGDVLATADTASAEIQVTVAQANLASAKARLATDKGGLTAVDKAAAKLQVTQARQSLANAKSSYAQTVKQNNLKLSQARVAADRARQAVTDAQRAHQPSSQVDQLISAWRQARENLATLQLQIPQSNAQAANQVTSASLGVQSAQYAYQQKLTPATEAQIASDEAAVAQAGQAVTTAQDALRWSSLTAPGDGIVLTVNIAPGSAAPSGAAITLRSTDLQVSASIAEADLPSVKDGQDVNVTLTALAKTVTGKVVRVDQSGTASASGGVVSYGLLVSLPSPPAGAAPGMSAQVSVTTQSAPNVLAIPAIALQSLNGQYAVRVLDAAGEPQSVPVEVGLVTSSLAEIKSGIQAGTAVVIGTTSTRQGTTTTGTTGIPGLGGGGGFTRGQGGGGGVFVPGVP